MKRRLIYVNAVQRAIERAQVLHPQARADLLGIVRASLDVLRAGAAEPAHAWRNLADALNVAEALALAVICSDDESLLVIAVGMETLAALADQHAKKGSWTLRAEWIKALEAAIERHELQLRFCSLGEYETARERVRNRTAAALAGNAPKGATIVKVARR